jgi:hypothetical protein
MKHAELIERLKDADAEEVMTTPLLEQAADAIESLQAEVERLSTELTKAQDELNCTEATLEAASCDLPSVDFDNGFDCMGDFAMAVWQGFKSERDALKLDAERYRWLLTDKADATLQDPEQSLMVDEVWQRVLDCGGNYTKTEVDYAIDAAMKGAAA